MTSRAKKWLWWILGIVIGIPILLVIFIVFIFDWNWVRGIAESKASTATGRDVKIGDMDVHFNWSLKPRIELDNISVSNTPGAPEPQMLQAEKINFRFNLLSAFSSRLDFPVIALHGTNAVLEKDAQGNANWEFGKKSNSNSPTPKIGELYIKNSKISYKDAATNTDLTVAANSSGDFRPDAPSNDKDFITLVGDGKYKNAPFTINYSGASVLDLQNRHDPYPLKTSLTVGKTKIDVEGTVLDPNELKGLNLTLTINGANAADLFPITGIALPPTPPYGVSGKLDYADKKWQFTGVKGHMGDSDISGDLSWDTNGKRPLLTAKFVSNNLNFKDLGGFVGAPPKDQPTDKLSDEQKAEIAKRAESPYVIPDAPLDISRLAAMDAKVEFTGNKVISPNLPLDNFYMNVNLDDRLLEIKPVKFGTANGDIFANLTINARQEPVTVDAFFQFDKLSLSRLLGPALKGLTDKNYNEGYIGGTAKLKGTGKSLRAMLANSDGVIGIGEEGGQMSSLLLQLIDIDVVKSVRDLVSGDHAVPLRCIVADFGVKNGLMQSKNIYIDTDVTNLLGQGTINLANEKLDITIKPRPKDKSILTLRSPISIGGTMKSPSFSIDPKTAIVRGGLAAAASVALTPVVGALAFIETGPGKDSDCQNLITQMNKDTGSNIESSLVPQNKLTSKNDIKGEKGNTEKPADNAPAAVQAAPKIAPKVPVLQGETSPSNSGNAH